MSQQEVDTIEGSLEISADARIAIVVARFNELICDQLLSGALETLHKHGVGAERIRVVRVPGAWELPLACQKLAEGKQVHGIVALGCVIRGGTPHFDFVAGQAAQGLSAVSLKTGVPIALGVITANTLQQALDRVDDAKVGHRGIEAALATLQMVSLCQTLAASGD